MGSFSVGAAKLFSARLPKLPNNSQLPSNGPGQPSILPVELTPCRCPELLLQPERCLRLVEGGLWSLGPAGSRAEGQGTGRDELTYAEHHPFSNKLISSTGAHLLRESHPIHHCNCLDVTLPARAWPLSPKSRRCAVPQLHSAARGSALPPDSLSPFLTSQKLLPFNPLASLSPEKPVLPQSRCSLCCERMAREERMSLPVLSLSCRQVLCPPACLGSRAMHGKPRNWGSWSQSSML